MAVQPKSQNKSQPPKPAAVCEVEAGAQLSVDQAWAKLAGRARLSDADRRMWVEACRQERLRWVIRERRKDSGDDA